MGIIYHFGDDEPSTFVEARTKSVIICFESEIIEVDNEKLEKFQNLVKKAIEVKRT
jgi:hypothetical protein